MPRALLGPALVEEDERSLAALIWEQSRPREPTSGVHARLDPYDIRRAAIASRASLPQCARLAELEDVILTIAIDVESTAIPEGARALRAPIDDWAGEVDGMLSRIPSVAAVVVGGANLALLEDGVVAHIRRERPRTPVIVRMTSGARSGRERLERNGMCAVTPDEFGATAAVLLGASVHGAVDHRRVAAEYGIDRDLTGRESELLWLASRIVQRPRVQAVMGLSESWFAQIVRGACSKTGVSAFAELGHVLA